MADDIKAGDAATITWRPEPWPENVSGARVLIRRVRPLPRALVVDKAGELVAGNGVKVTLSPAETAVAGLHRVEVEVATPLGPVTFPSHGYDTLRIRADLG